MDIDEIRRANLKALEREVGKPKQMAEAAGMSYAQYVNYRDGAFDKRSGKKRGMRKETAWRFEDACKKPRGWLDQVHLDGESALPTLPADVQARLAKADAATLHLVEMALYENDAEAVARLTPSLVAMVRALKVMIAEQGIQGG